MVIASNINTRDLGRVHKDMEGEQYQQQCFPLVHINDTDWQANISNDTTLYYFPSVTLDDSDARTENIHRKDSEALLLILLLLFLTVVTIWIFKVNRFRILHETGLSMLYGMQLVLKTYIIVKCIMYMCLLQEWWLV